jgi:hypothetical protein
MGQTLPFLLIEHRTPDGLWLRADQDKFSKTLKFLTVAGIDKLIILPRGWVIKFYFHDSMFKVKGSKFKV